MKNNIYFLGAIFSVGLLLLASSAVAHAQDSSSNDRVALELTFDHSLQMALQSASPDPAEHFGVMRISPTLRLTTPTGLSVYANASFAGVAGSSTTGTAGFFYRSSLINPARSTRLSLDLSAGVEVGEARRGREQDVFDEGEIVCLEFRGCARVRRSEPDSIALYGARPNNSLLRGGAFEAVLQAQLGRYFVLGIGAQARVHSVEGMRNVGITLAPVLRVGGRLPF